MNFKILFSVILFSSFGLFAQIDKKSSVQIKGMDFKLDTTSEKTDPKYNFSLKIPSQIKFSNKANPNLKDDSFDFLKNPKQANTTPDFMSKNDSDSDKDIQHIRYWYGENVTNKKMGTTQELGRIVTTSKKLRIECRDHSFVDGDRVRVYLNERVIYKNIVLTGSYFVINLNLDDGFNRIDIKALNQGSSGPNTAEFLVFDQTGNLISTKEWNMLTGNIATLVVIRN